MPDWKLGPVEARFADIIWRNEPLHSSQLVELSRQQLSWKKPTTYTVLRKLCQRGLFQNVDSTVTSLISRGEFYARQSEEYLNEVFDGSLPELIQAILTRKQLSRKDIRQIKQMLDSMTKTD